MISATEYREKRKALMTEYECEVRRWLSGKSGEELAGQVPFVLDGVVCPERWFRPGNTFRPLFVLKEVSFNITRISELPRRIRECGNLRQIEFAEFPFEDIRNGTCRQWQRIARLARALEMIHEGADKPDYSSLDMRFVQGGEAYTGDIAVYREVGARTANRAYNEIMDRIAVVELKKVAAGKTAISEISCATQHFSEHATQFRSFLLRQIELIDPTVIMCLGRDGGECISRYLRTAQDERQTRIWIDGYHHAYSSNKNFFDGPLSEYTKYLRQADGKTE